MGRKRDKIWAFLRHHWVTASWYISLQRKLQEKCAWDWYGSWGNTTSSINYGLTSREYRIRTTVPLNDAVPVAILKSLPEMIQENWTNLDWAFLHVGTQSFRFSQWPVWNFHNRLLWHSSFSVYLLIAFRIISTLLPYFTVTEFGLSLLLFTNIYKGYNNFSLCFSYL